MSEIRVHKKHFAAKGQAWTVCGLQVMSLHRGATNIESDVDCKICRRVLATKKNMKEANQDPMLRALNGLKGQFSQRRDWKNVKLIESAITRIAHLEKEKELGWTGKDTGVLGENFVPPEAAKYNPEVWDKLRVILVQNLGVRPEDIDWESDIVNDLGADSLDTVELVMAAEEEFNIEIPDDEAEKVHTVRQFYDAVQAKRLEKEKRAKK